MHKQTIDHWRSTAKAWLAYLRDVRVAGQVVFAVIVLLVSWSGVQAISTNYQLQKEIVALQQENTLQTLENENQQLQNVYYTSNQYLELSARQNFGLGASGETELLVPQAVAMSYVVPPPATPPASLATDRTPWYVHNLQAWLDFFLHRAPEN